MITILSVLIVLAIIFIYVAVTSAVDVPNDPRDDSDL